MREDLLTGEKFSPTRNNQKFVSRKNRIKFHNIRANKLRSSISHIERPLHINLKILNELLVDKKHITVHKEFLLGKGYSFGVLTHYEIYQEKQRPAIYNYIIVQKSDDNVLIIKYK